MERIKKSLTLILGAVVLLGAVYYYSNQPKPTSTANNSSNNQASASSAPNFSQLLGGDSFSYNGEEGKTALELLQSKAKVDMSGQGTSAFVTGINDRKADNAKKEYWGLYVNGYPSEVGAGSYTTKATDKIEWKITTY
ncbi:MAG: DUF4430 domain-containing protein [Patescibacteria group bacterium]|nr:DUF4430 domain-containing protein [Patescibacteria group bacterium]